ncbi:MAG: hypothetical protein C0483_00620 [Pirellula sp.]|nr:hypothetical protein [Pirellula sp.]
MPPIIAYHVVFSAYGFWLPNDPRGSGSDKVWAPKLRRFGPATKVPHGHYVARVPHARKLRLAAKEELARPPVLLTGVQARCVAQAVAGVAADFDIKIFAAAFMPDHAHLVIERGRHTAEEWTGYFKRAASRKLVVDELHPFAAIDGRRPTVWGAGGWKVYLHTPYEIARTIAYVDGNPARSKLPKQRWPFVTPYPAPRGRGG